MIVNKSITVRLYPNSEQEVVLNKLLGCYRFVYNNLLRYKIDNYVEDKTKLIGQSQLVAFVHHSLLKEHEFLKEHIAHQRF